MDLRGWKPAKKKDEPELPGLDGEMLELKVAKAWGMKPVEWRQQNVDDRAMMVAFEMFCDTCEGYRMENRAGQAAPAKEVKGPNPYHTMLSQWGLPVPGDYPSGAKRERPE